MNFFEFHEIAKKLCSIYNTTLLVFKRAVKRGDDYLKIYFFTGSNGSCSVHEWVGQFNNETVNYKMTSVCGHVMSLDFVGKYNSWDKVDPVRNHN